MQKLLSDHFKDSHKYSGAALETLPLQLKPSTCNKEKQQPSSQPRKAIAKRITLGGPFVRILGPATAPTEKGSPP